MASEPASNNTTDLTGNGGGGGGEENNTNNAPQAYYDVQPGILAIKPEFVKWNLFPPHRRPAWYAGSTINNNEGEGSGGSGAGGGKFIDMRDLIREGGDDDDAEAGGKGKDKEGGKKNRNNNRRDDRDNGGGEKLVKEDDDNEEHGESGGPVKKQKTQDDRDLNPKEGGGGGGGGRQKAKGMNTKRKFVDGSVETTATKRGGGKLCYFTARGLVCEKENCKFSHSLQSFLDQTPLGLQRFAQTDPALADSLDLPPGLPIVSCPLFDTLGDCPYGFRCNFLASHVRQVAPSEEKDENGNPILGGFQGTGLELVLDDTRKQEYTRYKEKVETGEGGQDGFAKGKLNDKGEINEASFDLIKQVRSKKAEFPLSEVYMKEIGEPMTKQDNNNRGKGKGKNKGKSKGDDNDVVMKDQPEAQDSRPASPEKPGLPDEDKSMDETNIESTSSTIKDNVDNAQQQEVDLAQTRTVEKRKLDFKGKSYLAPLTTTGNLPFRRLCKQYGVDITCGEMGLAAEFLGGNQSEWSLVRRHPCEQLYGVQICGSRPQHLAPAAEIISRECEIDFLDINLGCPIDLVFKKGAGSALLEKTGKLGKSLAGVSKVLGDIPLTVKMRTAIRDTQPLAHKLMPRMPVEWGVGALALHGRSRQQRYTKRADWNYISECTKAVREAAPDIPVIGNGDVYSHQEYYEDLENSGVDTIMIGRGALIKPWLFTEIKERRDWDISARERLDGIGQLCKFGLEHWGSDVVGVNTTRRFVCEALSFQYRYVPIGILERLPPKINERPFPFQGRSDLETLLSSDNAQDWVKISSFFLPQPPDNWHFDPKHKSNAYGDQNG